ncbi:MULTISPECIES: winged helix-turn-helix domain-containing protein, partial [unclassified Streptomyces]|uniref:helix-turn-helix domain-containing protein n=1 Tax=unclassified Streptomyces TaxID=2593676 RepID=UPI0029AEBCB2
MIRRRLRVSLSVATVWWLLKRYGWSWQAPARRALERDEHAVELWKKETSHADNESSCFGGELCRWLVGEGLGLV